jgi:hypothetical protein
VFPACGGTSPFTQQDGDENEDDDEHDESLDHRAGDPTVRDESL